MSFDLSIGAARKLARASDGGLFGVKGWALGGTRERAIRKPMLRIERDLVGTSSLVSLEFLAGLSLNSSLS